MIKQADRKSVKIQKTWTTLSTVVEYIFISGEDETFIKIDYIVGPITILNKFKSTEITQVIFSEHNRITLEISIKISRKSQIFETKKYF